MLLPNDIRERLQKTLLKKKSELLADVALSRPFEEVSFKLKPSKKEALADIAAFDRSQYVWTQEVSKYVDRGVYLYYEPVRWSGGGGDRSVIARVCFRSLEGALTFAGGQKLYALWRRSEQKLNMLTEGKSEAFIRRLSKESELLEAAGDLEFNQVIKLEDYLLHHEADCYIRELPIEGVDTKFLEKHARLICDLLSIELERSITKSDLYEEWRIKKLPDFVRVRHANVFFNGLPSDLIVQLPISALTVKPRALVVVENVQTGLAVKDVPEDVPILMGLGFSVRLLSEVPWIRDVPIFYFGDLDMHGMAILAAFRKTAPQVCSVLMDVASLDAFKQYAVTDPNLPNGSGPVIALNAEEAKLYDRLVKENIRLEQERIPIAVFETALKACFKSLDA